MKTLRTGSPPPAGSQHAGKLYNCPHCGALNQIEKGDTVGSETTNNSGMNGGPVLQGYHMPACPTCRRPGTIEPHALMPGALKPYLMDAPGMSK